MSSGDLDTGGPCWLMVRVQLNSMNRDQSSAPRSDNTPTTGDQETLEHRSWDVTSEQEMMILSSADLMTSLFMTQNSGKDTQTMDIYGVMLSSQHIYVQRTVRLVWNEWSYYRMGKLKSVESP